MTPENAMIDMLLAQLNEADESLRRMAVEELGELRDPRAIPALARMLGEEKHIGVLEAAGEALVKIGGLESAGAVVPLLATAEVFVKNLVCEVLIALGETALGAVIPLLKSPDHDVRKFAADVIGDIRSASAVGALIDSMADPDVNVICSALEALGKIGSGSAIDAMINAARGENSDAAYYAVLALGRVRDERVADFLLSLLSETSNPILRFAAVEAMGFLGNRRTVRPLLGLLEGKDAALGKVVFKALGRIDVRYLESVFLRTANEDLLRRAGEALRENDPELRKYALIALGAVGRPLFENLLLEFLRNEDETLPFVMQNLVRMGRVSMEFLLPLLDDPSDRVRELGATIIGDVQNPAAVGRLRVLLGDASPIVRRSAVRALGKFSVPEVLEPVLSALGDDDDSVRTAAATSLGWMRAAEGIPRLVELLAGASLNVADAAQGALLMIGGGAVESSLAGMLASPDALLRARAVAALGGLERTGEIRNLITGALGDSAPEVRRAAVRALGEKPDPGLAGAIMPLSRDAHPSVRRAAVKALGRISDECVIPTLLAALDDGDVWVQYEAIHSAARFPREDVCRSLQAALGREESVLRIAVCESLAALQCRAAEPQIESLAA
jgi:HEAT repeat protein